MRNSRIAHHRVLGNASRKTSSMAGNGLQVQAPNSAKLAVMVSHPSPRSTGGLGSRRRKTGLNLPVRWGEGRVHPPSRPASFRSLEKRPRLPGGADRKRSPWRQNLFTIAEFQFCRRRHFGGGAAFAADPAAPHCCATPNDRHPDRGARRVL